MRSIAGQYTDVLEIFKSIGSPSKTSYLFLGDYVDRGSDSLEVISLLLGLQCLLPDAVYLLRGNHECRRTNRKYGFYDELHRKLPQCEADVGGLTTCKEGSQKMRISHCCCVLCRRSMKISILSSTTCPLLVRNQLLEIASPV